MPRPALSRVLRTRVLRTEILPFVPAGLLCGLWFGGEMVLVVAALVFPALWWLGGPAPLPASAPVDVHGGLPEGAVLAARIETAVADAGPQGAAVLAVGLDSAERVAAHHGPAVTAHWLDRAADRLRGVLRRGDLLGRLDGPVFAVVVRRDPRADLEGAIQIAARLQEALAEPALIDGRRVAATVSVGLCLAPAGDGGASALARALDALDLAQAAGDGSIRAHVPGQPPAAARRAARDAAATAALEDGQIVAWFQPQVSTDSGLVSGMEALARWVHPDRGPIAPADFLPALAAAGRMDRLGEVMLYHGLTAMRAWDRSGQKVPMLGLNLSAEELGNPRLAEKLAFDLDRFDLAPPRLAVEILETVVAGTGDDCAARGIRQLADLGCRIDLDDFGTGAASIAALRRFRVHRIKIDRSLVVNLDEDTEQQRMVAAILGMAERLGLDTLAEGVERLGEHAMLAQLGCGHVQGYGIARPMPFDETLAWMARHADRIAPPYRVARRIG